MTEQVRIWAGLQGFVSLAALLALVLFFALARPFPSPDPRWSWLGPVNDWLSVLGAVPWIVAMILLAVRVRAGAALWLLTLVAILGVAALATVTVLMLAGRAGLEAQTLTAVPATVAGFVWMAVAGSAARAAGVLPPWVSVLAIVLPAALLLGAAAAGIGYLQPAGSPAKLPLYVAAGVFGLPAWFAFPGWWLVVATTAR